MFFSAGDSDSYLPGNPRQGQGGKIIDSKNDQTGRDSFLLKGQRIRIHCLWTQLVLSYLSLFLVCFLANIDVNRCQQLEQGLKFLVGCLIWVGILKNIECVGCWMFFFAIRNFPYWTIVIYCNTRLGYVTLGGFCRRLLTYIAVFWHIRRIRGQHLHIVHSLNCSNSSWTRYGWISWTGEQEGGEKNFFRIIEVGTIGKQNTDEVVVYIFTCLILYIYIFTFTHVSYIYICTYNKVNIYQFYMIWVNHIYWPLEVGVFGLV